MQRVNIELKEAKTSKKIETKQKVTKNEKSKIMQTLPLSNIKQEECAYIKELSSNLKYETKRRLLELGFVENAFVKVSAISTLREVMLIEINGFLLSIRADMAENIICKAGG